ncbi:MAG: cupin domain-containing protein [Bacteroidales bacterium]|nr:cupin domain-containing protein [Bacteroidales bacterium]
MQIILLSGGSGKRLWPLSNNTRSKQFLKLLPAGGDATESMVQRVVRQIRDAQLTDSIIVATGANQKDIISNQLGGSVEVVSEPSRRDTFPAIALASMYIADKKQCSSSEVVVVMPCDPFTEVGYFQTIEKMASEVEHGKADLILMGIKPTYPSTKYGYVVPSQQHNDGIAFSVERFTEKPDEKRAAELISQNAFWNGGVFAFRLGYMTDIVKQQLDVNSIIECYDRYAELPKISFDYEVVEKASSIVVVPFSGLWKDLGTWDSLSGEIKKESIGNVVMGDNNSGTLVINELNIPILCEGAKDMIIAADPDGILVCSKEHSEGIKSLVEQVKSRPMYEERRWGDYKVLDHTLADNGYESLTKQLHLKPGCKISYQLHHCREEVWSFIEGEGIIKLDGEETSVKAGQVVRIKKEQLHGLKAITDLRLIEVQLGTNLVEEDIVRVELDW